MADNSSNGDLLNLDEATESSLESGAGASSGDPTINAAEMFQQQLEQMTSWKTQLNKQMELMQRDGLKLMERQKNLAQEKVRLTDERTKIAAERAEIQKLQSDIQSENKRLLQHAAELEDAQRRLLELQARREQADRELDARQKGLSEQEARQLSENVRLREELEQLELQRQALKKAHHEAAADRQKLDAEARDLAARAQALQQHDQNLTGREQSLDAARRELEHAGNELRARQDETTRREQALAEKIRITDEQLQSRAAALQAGEQQLAQDRQTAANLRHELNRRVETFENEQAEQLEAMAKQTRLLTQRRAAVEAAEKEFENILVERIAQATQTLKIQLAEAEGGQTQRVKALEEQFAQTHAAMESLQAREAHFQQDISAANDQLARLKEELAGATASLQRVSSERSAIADQLAQQISLAKEEAARWQKELDAAQAKSAGGNKELEEALALASTARKELKQAKSKYAELQKAKDELEFQLELRKDDTQKQLEAQRAELAQQIAQRDSQIAEWKQKYESTQTSGKSNGKSKGTSAQDAEKISDLARQLQTLEQQRQELATQLTTVQEILCRQQEETLLSKNVHEALVQELQSKNSALESEKASWKQRVTKAPSANDPQGQQVAAQTQWHRERLLRHARALRGFRQQMRDTHSSLDSNRSEIAQQREQLRARKENLEQVKRLLEKQEMVMARKLADHNAIKTVAVVGIFVIMVLGGAFFGVYRFVHPVYRSEAVVQLAVPQNLQGAEMDGWLKQQLDFMRTSEVNSAAWKVLRSSDEHYSMHDVREEWINSLPAHLSLTLDGPSKTLSIRYTGPDAEGVSQVCNALSTAYTMPGLRDTATEETKAVGLGSQVLAKATVPMYPVEDNRMMVCLSVVGITLFVSLLLVMIFRYFISRQLREIDQMADANELEEMQGEITDAAKPAIE